MGKVKGIIMEKTTYVVTYQFPMGKVKVLI